MDHHMVVSLAAQHWHKVVAVVALFISVYNRIAHSKLIKMVLPQLNEVSEPLPKKVSLKKKHKNKAKK